MNKKLSLKNKRNINKIFHESCLDTLQKLEDQSIDLVITSPPYNMNLRISKGRYHSRQIVKELSTKYEGFSDNLPLNDFYEFHSKVLKELLRVSDLVFYIISIVTGSKRAFFQMIGDFSDNLKEIFVWDKSYGIPAMPSKTLNRRVEFVLVFEKDYPISRQFRNRAQFDRGTLEDLWEIKRDRSEFSSHGAVFPKELVKKSLKNFSQTGDIIYDPFSGTGTTAVVSKEMGRTFIGSEIIKKFVNLSRKRLRETKTNFD